jgi:hypothetical protein
MPRLVVNSVVVAFALPLCIAAWAAGGLGAGRSVAWFLLLHSGIFYPVFDAGDLQGSWGGRTLLRHGSCSS